MFGVILGTGVGGGIAIGGRILVGANAIAGEWGHNPLPWPVSGRSARDRPATAAVWAASRRFFRGPALAADHRRSTGQTWWRRRSPPAPPAATRRAGATLERYADRLARALAVRHQPDRPGRDRSRRRPVGHSCSIRRSAAPLGHAMSFPTGRHPAAAAASTATASGVRGAAWLWPPDELTGDHDRCAAIAAALAAAPAAFRRALPRLRLAAARARMTSWPTWPIAHLDCDAFYATVEKRDRPELAEPPVIVGGGARGVVLACCYVARLYGVRSAMPMFKALAACPDAVVIRPDMAKYREVGRAVRAEMRRLTPLVEPLSIDEAFLDLSGTGALHGALRRSSWRRSRGGSRRRSASPSRSGSATTSFSPSSPPTSTSRAASR